MANEKPNFIIRGLKRFAETTLGLGILGIGASILWPVLMMPSIGLTGADIAINSYTAKYHMPYAAA